MKRSLIFFLILIVSISLTTTGIHSTASSPEDLPENDDTYEIYLKKDYIKVHQIASELYHGV